MDWEGCRSRWRTRNRDSREDPDGGCLDARCWMLASRILSCARAEYNGKRVSGCACARISPSRWIEAGSETYPDSHSGSGSDSEFGSESCRYMHMHMCTNTNANTNRHVVASSSHMTPERSKSFIKKLSVPPSCHFDQLCHSFITGYTVQELRV